MLEPWTSTETALTFAVSILGDADGDAVASSLASQAAALLAPLGTTRVACAPTAYASVILSVWSSNAAAAAVEAALRNKELVCAGARCRARLASSASRHPEVVGEAAEPPAAAPRGALCDVDEDEWCLLRRHFLSRSERSAGDKRASWARDVRAAARAHADRPWRECRWHEPRDDDDDASDGGESKDEPRRDARRAPSFFAAPPRRRRRRAAAESEDESKDESKGDESKGDENPRAGFLRARRRELLARGVAWPLDATADEATTRARDAASPARDASPARGAEPLASVVEAARALAVLLRNGPSVSELAADVAGGRRGALAGAGERAVLKELAAPTAASAALDRDPRMWGDAAANAFARRAARTCATLRWYALARRAIAASWPFVTFAEFAEAYGSRVAGRRDAPPPSPKRATPWERRRRRDAAAAADAPRLTRVDLAPAAAAPPDDAERAAFAQFRKSVFGGPGRDVQASLVPRAVARRLAARTEADDGDIWRVVRGALRGRARPVPGVLPWDECAADVWPELWRAYGDRWRVGVA